MAGAAWKHTAWILGGVVAGCAGAPADPADELESGDGYEAEAPDPEERAAISLERAPTSGTVAWAVTNTLFGGIKGVDTDARGDVYLGISSIAASGARLAPSSGALLWSRGGFAASAFAVPSEGGILLAGTTLDASAAPCAGLEELGRAILKLGRDGRCVWSRALPPEVVPNDMAVDDRGNIYLASLGYGVVDWEAWTSTPDGFSGYYLTKLGPTGALVWAQTLAGPVVATEVDDRLRVVATDADHVYASVTVRGDFRVGDRTVRLPENDEGLERQAALLARFSERGRVEHARAYGESATSGALAVDRTGRVAVAGRFQGTITFGDRTYTNGTASRDVYVAVLGDELDMRWAKRLWGSATQTVDGLDFDPAGNLSMVGDFRSWTGETRRLHVGPNLFETTSTRPKMFAARFSPKTGTTLWAKEYGADTGSLRPNDLAVDDATGDLLITGMYAGDTGVLPGDRGAFVMRLRR